jgi:hypothetical protein
MPWKERGVMEERFRFIDDWRSGDWTVTELCRHYEVTRATGYKWLSRYKQGGVDNLRDQSRAPLHHPNELPGEIEDLVIAMRDKHPSWGAPKIRGPDCARSRGDAFTRREYDWGDSEAEWPHGGARRKASEKPSIHRATGACQFGQ